METSTRGCSSFRGLWLVVLGHGLPSYGSHYDGHARVYVRRVAEESERRLAFVLHDHRKPRPHFDLRLEEGGVLRSWAVPRGLPTSTGEDHLAIEVDDHDLDHLDYTDDDKFIADSGWWEEHDRNDRRILFTLHGSGPARRYALIRTDKDWLLHLTKYQS